MEALSGGSAPLFETFPLRDYQAPVRLPGAARAVVSRLSGCGIGQFRQNLNMTEQDRGPEIHVRLAPSVSDSRHSIHYRIEASPNPSALTGV